MDNSSPSPDESFTREQILPLMAINALLFFLLAKGIQALFHIELMTISWDASALWKGAVTAIVIALTSMAVYALLPQYRTSMEYQLNLIIKPLLWGDLIWLGLLPGISEEILFRGVLIPGLGMGIIAIVVSGLVFGVLHYHKRSGWPHVLWITCIGWGLGSIMIVTQNLLVPIVAHLLTNITSGTLWKLKLQNDLPS
jgi:membrane protease YdiL (CAAX protease family)